jgi:hypothetical protein
MGMHSKLACLKKRRSVLELTGWALAPSPHTLFPARAREPAQIEPILAGLKPDGGVNFNADAFIPINRKLAIDLVASNSAICCIRDANFGIKKLDDSSAAFEPEVRKQSCGTSPLSSLDLPRSHRFENH